MLAAAADLLDQGQIVNRLSIAVTAIAIAILLLPMLPPSEATLPTAAIVAVVGLIELAVAMRVSLDAALFRRLAEDAAAERLDVAAGTTIVEQGAAGDRFYLVADGEIDVVLGGVTMATLRSGDYFGEIALLRDVPRTANCVARTDAEIYMLGRDVFVAAVSGDMRSSAEAETVMTRRLDEQSGVGDGSVAQ